MKFISKINILLVILIIVITGCNDNRKSRSQNNDLNTVSLQDTVITVDVSKKYPKKELILQDIMDVEYIPLESKDDFLCQGIVQAVSKDIIIVKNIINDGDIFIFGRNGKGLRKFNRKGQGAEEYIFNLNTFIDEENNEIYIDEVIRNIQVYDLYGNYLRSIQRDKIKWINANNYNSDYLIARESPSAHKGKDTDNQLFVLISKINGSIVKDFRIYFDKKVEWGITNNAGNTGAAPRPYPIVPYNDTWLLIEPSSDTIYKISPNYSLTPFMTRTPSIQSMKPAIFLIPCIFTERYHFMETVTMEADLLRNEGFPKTHLAYDKKENLLFEYNVFNDDFLAKGPMQFTVQETANKEIALWQKLEPHELIEAYTKGQLKGKLKEIAAELEEDSNPVIMLIKYKYSK